MKNLTVRVTVNIAASPETVWDFTQDWTRRTTWDQLIVSATVLDDSPRIVKVTARGAAFFVRYKASDRPRKTSLVMTDVESPWFSGGGGSWSYEPDGAGTRWTQTNTLIARNSIVRLLFGWLLRWQLAASTKRAMLTAKALVERAESS